MLDLSNITLIGQRVLLRAVEERTLVSGLYIPFEATERYPSSALIIASAPDCNETFTPGELAVIPNEGFHAEQGYWQVFGLLLKDFGELHIDADTEPAIREAHRKYQRTGEDVQITTRSIEGEGYQFLASDIEAFNLIDLKNPDYKTEYISASFIRTQMPGEAEELYYIIHESRIICLIEW